MSLPTGPGLSQDALFLVVVRKLRAALQMALYDSEMADAGLFQVYPRTHWRELGLAPQVALPTVRASSSPPLSQAPTVSPRVYSTVSSTVFLPVTSSPCVSPCFSLALSSWSSSVLPVASVGSDSCRAVLERIRITGTGTGQVEAEGDDRGDVAAEAAVGMFIAETSDKVLHEHADQHDGGDDGPASAFGTANRDEAAVGAAYLVTATNPSVHASGLSFGVSWKSREEITSADQERPDGSSVVGAKSNKSAGKLEVRDGC